MTNSQRLAMVRACLSRWLSENRLPETSQPQHEPLPGEEPSRCARTPGADGTPGAESTPGAECTPRADSGPLFSESILVRDEFYCGRCFDAGSHRAVWFLEEDELKISTDTGQLLCVLAGKEITQMAAGDSVDRGDSADILPLRAAASEPAPPETTEQTAPPTAEPAARRAA